MITVRGEDPETVQLPDLQDFIYYKQVKTFSEAEYKKSNCLQRSISKGSVIVLKRVDEKFSDYEVPRDAQVKESSDSSLNPLIDLLKNLESKLDQSGTTSNNLMVDLLVQKIDALEKKIQGPVVMDNSALAETVRKLEEKVNSNSDSPALKKLDEILSKFSGLSSGRVSTDKPVDTGTPEEVYVPSIKVEDGNSHINLKVRTIEKSDDINSAAEALRKLRKTTT